MMYVLLTLFDEDNVGSTNPDDWYMLHMGDTLTSVVKDLFDYDDYRTWRQINGGKEPTPEDLIPRHKIVGPATEAEAVSALRRYFEDTLREYSKRYAADKDSRAEQHLNAWKEFAHLVSVVDPSTGPTYEQANNLQTHFYRYMDSRY